jgi:hypothetical protein
MDIQFETTTLMLIGIAAAAFVAVVVAGFAINYLVARRRAGKLRNRFGSEYDRAIERTGDKKQAERELADRMERVRSFRLHDLPDGQREQYIRAWHDIQADFVDHPTDALFRADALVTDVMRSRGYADVSEGPGRRAADLSVFHADEADDYRHFCHTAERGRAGTASTEELRLALRRLRRVFNTLIARTEYIIETKPADSRSPSAIA